MKTEDQAWESLRRHAAAQISPGFPDRVLREARAHSSPLIVSHFAMCAATAALCMVAVALYHARTSAADEAQSVAGWDEIAAQAGDLDLGL